MSQKRGGMSASAIQTRIDTGLVRTYREAVFYIMTNFAAGMAESIDASFEATMYGSPRNAFFKYNYAAVVAAVNGSPLGLELLDQIMHEQNFTGVSVSDTVYISAFDVEGWNSLFNAYYAAGGRVSIVRSTIAGKVTYVAGVEAAVWDDFEDPGLGKVTGFVVTTAAADAQGQPITNIRVEGSNLVAPLDFVVKVAGVTTAGSWNGLVWTPTAAARYAGTQTISILKGTRVLASRDVVFHSTSIGGE